MSMMKSLYTFSFLFLFSHTAWSDASVFRKAECKVTKTKGSITEIIIEAKSIDVTSSNGGLRQSCQYTASDNKTKLLPVVADGQGGLMIVLYYESKIILRVQAGEGLSEGRGLLEQTFHNKNEVKTERI